MKSILKILSVAIFAISLTLFYSCKPDGLQTVEHDLMTQDFEQTPVDLEFQPEVSDHVQTLNMDLENPEVYSFEFPDGTKEDRFLIEGDLALTRADLQKLKEEANGDLRQYRTYNLVSSPRTIRVIGYTGGGNALTSKMRTSLQWAINNYNALNMGLNFQLSFGTNYGNKDIVVYQVNGGAGGVAGFPSGGRPYKWVQIFSGMQNYNNNTIEHVMTHEIGHCLGLRHTDYASRASCNQSGEGAGSAGAVHIPGTPTGIDWNSIMLACFGSNEDGEFGYYDRVALEYLY